METSISPYVLPGATIKREEVRRAHITEDLIKETCSRAYGITVEELERNTRLRAIAEPRQVAMHLIRFSMGKSLHEAALPFRKNHATVVHATKVVRKLMMYTDFRERYDAICAEIGYK